MISIPPDKKRGWEVTIDGIKMHPSIVRIESKFGELIYGLRPEGYDAWVFKEIGGGGAVTIPFVIDQKNGTLLVGLLPESRPNMGGLQLCAVGGFIDPGESHKDAAVREAEEESGLDIEAEKIEGVTFNSNRAFFVADPSCGEGMHTWGVRIPFEWLSFNNNDGTWHIAQLPNGSAERLGKATKVVFMPWIRAVRESADGIALAAIARLVATLAESGYDLGV